MIGSRRVLTVLWGVLVVCLVLAVSGAAARQSRSRPSAPGLEFNPEALLRSIRFLSETRGEAYPRGRAFLADAEAFVAEMPAIRAGLAAGDAEAQDALERYRRLAREALVDANPFVDCNEILVVQTRAIARKANWLGTHTIRPRGHHSRIARFNLRTGALRGIYTPDDGAFVGELDLHYHGDRLLFTSVDDDDHYQVMEIGIDGSGLRQVSTLRGPDVHNYGGIYLPNEKIIFSSTAPMVGVPCIGGGQSVPNLFLMDRDGGRVRQLTFEQDADWYPTVLADGKIMYLRWEYTDQMHYYSRIMMTMNPDGTNQRSIYGSQSLWPNSMFNARPLPGAPGCFAAVVSGHHGNAGVGKLTLFDSNRGFVHADGVIQHVPGYGKPVVHVTVDQLYPQVQPALRERFPDLQTEVDRLLEAYLPASQRRGRDLHTIDHEFYNRCYPHLRERYPEMALDLDRLTDGVYPQCYQPYPISDRYFLVVAKLGPSQDWGLYLADVFDNFVPLRPADPQGDRYLIEPYPLRPRPRPPVLPERVNLAEREATCYIQDIYRGPGLRGVPRGTVKALRVFTYAYGYYKLGSHNHLGVESGWDVKRVLGTVPVEEDGSARFQIPANTTLSLQPLDDEGRAIQLFRSWLVAMPGEQLSCVGCHEAPSEPPVARMTLAAGRPPRRIEPYGPTVTGFSFQTEIQPLLDAYCVRCHDGTDSDRPNFQDTRVLHAGRAAANFSESYYAFSRYFRRPGPESSALMAMPYEYHASTSEGVQLLEKGHHGVRLDDEAWRRLFTWIDLNVPYHGTWTETYADNRGRSQWAADVTRRAREERARFAHVTSDWEATPAVRPLAVVRSTETPPAAATPVTVPDWPCDREAARARQRAAGPAVTRRLELGDDLSLTLVRIPAGTFVMGSDEETPQERPRHAVTVPRAFWMSETEVTNRLFKAYQPEHDPGVFDQQWKDHVRRGYTAAYAEQPAVRLSWQDAMGFCAWVARRTGRPATLPTEAQWEWACRAGTDTALSFGARDTDFAAYANLADRSLERFAVRGVNPTFKPQYVGNPMYDVVLRAEADDGQFLVTGTRQYRPNAWGLYDMHGNVAEWTRSDYVAYPYDAESANSLSPETRKVVRGGSFFDRPYRATSSYRLGYLPWQGVFNVGFRIVVED